VQKITTKVGQKGQKNIINHSYLPDRASHTICPLCPPLYVVDSMLASLSLSLSLSLDMYISIDIYLYIYLMCSQSTNRKEIRQNHLASRQFDGRWALQRRTKTHRR